MAADDAKLKFLPRHLQRSQPASSSKSKRRVTVEDETAGDEESDRRSVFERLGPGGLQRNEKPKTDYLHHNLKGRNKNEGEKSPDNLRLKFKGSKDRETKVRSQVVPLVMKKADDAGSDNDSADESDNWSIDNLEDKKERELEQKRQEIQRALKALEDGDDAPVIDLKKSDSSGSQSSPERTHKKKKDKLGKKKEKKKHKKSASEKEPSLEQQGKRKHGSDEEENSPRKKKRKKNKERKHAEEVLPPPLMSLDVRKNTGSKPSKGEPQLYEPESPTSTHKSDSPDGKGKKKKKKMKAQTDVSQGKSKKLLSPLKKVLKLKKGPASVSSSKMSRSESRDSLKRKLSRSTSSSSSGSSVESPVTKRRVQDPSAEEQHDRGRTESKSLERKRKRKQVQPPQQYHHRHRSVSSSSTSSSPSSHSSDRGFDHRHSKGRGNRPKTGDQTSRQQLRHKKRSKSPNEIRKEGRSAKKKRDASAESWNRSKDRKGTGKGESPQRQQRGAGAGGSGMDRGRQRNRQIQHGLKASRNISQPSGRRVGNRKDRAESPHFSKDRQRRGADSSVDRAEKDGREREKRERNVRKDDSRDRAGPTSKVRDRLEEQGRSGRMASGGGGAFAQQAERGGRLITRRGNSADRDSRRNFGGSEISGRMGQFPRPDLDRGQMGGRMGHIWDEGRREGPGDWETGPERRAFGGPRDDSTGSGKRRDGGREERLLPHPARGGPVRSGSQDRLLSRGGHGQRDEFNNGQDRVRDRRGTLQEGDGNKRERDNNRGGREENRAGRGRDDSIKCRPAERDDNFNKDREVRDRNKGVSGNRSASGVSLLPGRGEESGNRVVSKLKSELIKEDSPSAMRGESSLAAVFDQTETTRASNVLTTSSTKRRTTKSFGGKKSPKKTSADDSKTLEEKGRLRLGGRAERLVAADKKKSALSDTERGAKKITPSRDNQKGDGRTMAKHETASKERTSPGSQRSADSHHSRSRSSRKSSQSPDNRREVATTQDCSSSLQSPATASYEQQSRKSKEKDNKNAAALGRGRRRGAGDKVKTSEAGDHRGRSESLSDAESKNSPGLQERRRRKSSDSIESLPAKLDGGDIAAAMLGDGAEDGQQDVFSDWSDDDDTFNTIIDDDPRKHHVEDLDDNHDFSYGSRGHSHDLRGRRTSPATADPAPGMLLHGSGLMEAGMGHHDGHGAGLGREGYPHQLHYSSAAGQYFGNEMIMGGSHGDGSHNGQLLSSRIDQESRAQVDDLLAKPALEKNIPGVKIVEDIQKEKPARERRRRDTGEEGYEEISSDENDLDEEGEKIPKRTIVSILDIDMSSLAQITKPSRPLSPSVSGRPAVFQRYKACSVFSQLGLSRQLAGEALFEQVQAVCQKQLEQQESLMEKDTIKQGDGEAAVEKTKPSVGIGMKSAMATISSTQPSSFSSISSPSSSLPANAQSFAPAYNLDDSIASSTKNLDIKEETENLESSDNTLTVSSKNASPKPITPESEHPQFEPVAKVEPVTARKLLMPDKKVKKPEFKLYGDAPSDHILQKARAQKRAALLGNFGLFRRALTARKDLSIRRQLCKIDSNYDQSAIYPSGLADPDMFRASLQLLKQKTACMMTTK